MSLFIPVFKPASAPPPSIDEVSSLSLPTFVPVDAEPPVEAPRTVLVPDFIPDPKGSARLIQLLDPSRSDHSLNALLKEAIRIDSLSSIRTFKHSKSLISHYTNLLAEEVIQEGPSLLPRSETFHLFLKNDQQQIDLLAEFCEKLVNSTNWESLDFLNSPYIKALSEIEKKSPCAQKLYAFKERIYEFLTKVSNQEYELNASLKNPLTKLADHLKKEALAMRMQTVRQAASLDFARWEDREPLQARRINPDFTRVSGDVKNSLEQLKSERPTVVQLKNFTDQVLSLPEGSKEEATVKAEYLLELGKIYCRLPTLAAFKRTLSWIELALALLKEHEGDTGKAYELRGIVWWKMSKLIPDKKEPLFRKRMDACYRDFHASAAYPSANEVNFVSSFIKAKDLKKLASLEKIITHEADYAEAYYQAFLLQYEQDQLDTPTQLEKVEKALATFHAFELAAFYKTSLLDKPNEPLTYNSVISRLNAELLIEVINLNASAMNLLGEGKESLALALLYNCRAVAALDRLPEQSQKSQKKKLDLLIKRGLIYQRLGLKNNAALAFEDAISFRATTWLKFINPSLHFTLGNLYLQLGRSEEADEQFDIIEAFTTKYKDKIAKAKSTPQAPSDANEDPFIAFQKQNIQHECYQILQDHFKANSGAHPHRHVPLWETFLQQIDQSITLKDFCETLLSFLLPSEKVKKENLLKIANFFNLELKDSQVLDEIKAYVLDAIQAFKAEHAKEQDEIAFKLEAAQNEVARVEAFDNFKKYLRKKLRQGQYIRPGSLSLDKISTLHAQLDELSDRDILIKLAEIIGEPVDLHLTLHRGALSDLFSEFTNQDFTSRVQEGVLTIHGQTLFLGSVKEHVETTLRANPHIHEVHLLANQSYIDTSLEWPGINVAIGGQYVEFLPDKEAKPLCIDLSGKAGGAGEDRQGRAADGRHFSGRGADGLAGLNGEGGQPGGDFCIETKEPIVGLETSIIAEINLSGGKGGQGGKGQAGGNGANGIKGEDGRRSIRRGDEADSYFGYIDKRRGERALPGGKGGKGGDGGLGGKGGSSGCLMMKPPLPPLLKAEEGKDGEDGEPGEGGKGGEGAPDGLDWILLRRNPWTSGEISGYSLRYKGHGSDRLRENWEDSLSREETIARSRGQNGNRGLAASALGGIRSARTKQNLKREQLKADLVNHLNQHAHENKVHAFDEVVNQLAVAHETEEILQEQLSLQQKRAHDLETLQQTTRTQLQQTKSQKTVQTQHARVATFHKRTRIPEVHEKTVKELRVVSEAFIKQVEEATKKLNQAYAAKNQEIKLKKSLLRFFAGDRLFYRLHTHKIPANQIDQKLAWFQRRLKQKIYTLCDNKADEAIAYTYAQYLQDQVCPSYFKAERQKLQQELKKLREGHDWILNHLEELCKKEINLEGWIKEHKIERVQKDWAKYGSTVLARAADNSQGMPVYLEKNRENFEIEDLGENFKGLAEVYSAFFKQYNDSQVCDEWFKKLITDDSAEIYGMIGECFDHPRKSEAINSELEGILYDYLVRRILILNYPEEEDRDLFLQQMGTFCRDIYQTKSLLPGIKLLNLAKEAVALRKDNPEIEGEKVKKILLQKIVSYEWEDTRELIERLRTKQYNPVLFLLANSDLTFVETREIVSILEGCELGYAQAFFKNLLYDQEEAFNFVWQGVLQKGLYYDQLRKKVDPNETASLAVLLEQIALEANFLSLDEQITTLRNLKEIVFDNGCFTALAKLQELQKKLLGKLESLPENLLVSSLIQLHQSQQTLEELNLLLESIKPFETTNEKLKSEILISISRLKQQKELEARELQLQKVEEAKNHLYQAQNEILSECSAILQSTHLLHKERHLATLNLWMDYVELHFTKDPEREKCIDLYKKAKEKLFDGMKSENGEMAIKEFHTWLRETFNQLKNEEANVLSLIEGLKNDTTKQDALNKLKSLYWRGTLPYSDEKDGILTHFNDLKDEELATLLKWKFDDSMIEEESYYVRQQILSVQASHFSEDNLIPPDEPSSLKDEEILKYLDDLQNRLETYQASTLDAQNLLQLKMATKGEIKLKVEELELKLIDLEDERHRLKEEKIAQFISFTGLPSKDWKLLEQMLYACETLLGEETFFILHHIAKKINKGQLNQEAFIQIFWVIPRLNNVEDFYEILETVPPENWALVLMKKHCQEAGAPLLFQLKSELPEVNISHLTHEEKEEWIHKTLEANAKKEASLRQTMEEMLNQLVASPYLDSMHKTLLLRIVAERLCLLQQKKLGGSFEECIHLLEANLMSPSVLKKLNHELQIPESDIIKLFFQPSFAAFKQALTLAWIEGMLPSLSHLSQEDRQKLINGLLTLESRKKEERMRQVVKSLSEGYSLTPAVVECVINFADEHWVLDEATLRFLKERFLNDDWYSQISSYSHEKRSKTRDLDALVELMALEKGGINSSIDSLLSGTLKEDILAIQREYEEVKEWGEKEITEWVSENRGERFLEDEKRLKRGIAVVSRASQLVEKHPLRETQLIALWLMLRKGEQAKGRIAQMFTGEGKSITFACLAILCAMGLSQVDIITTSFVLAERDAREKKKLYDLFGLTVSNNCDPLCEADEEQRKERYFRNGKPVDIVYGDVGAFERDLLLTEFHGKEIIHKNRLNSQRSVLVDEVDGLFLDNAGMVLYLSHTVDTLRVLEKVFVDIWAACNQTNASFQDDDAIERITQRVLENLASKEGCLPSYHISHARYMEMKHMIERKLPLWVRSALYAKVLRVNNEYIVTEQVINGKSKQTIIVMDKGTGVEQVSLKWSQGLHQFLQLKHGLELSSESLKAVFLSNYFFFKEYKQNIYGLSGTLGSDIEQKYLKELYNVDLCKIPRFKGEKFVQHGATVTGSKDEWVSSIKNSIDKKLHDEKRAVLVICDSVEEVMLLKKELKKQYPHLQTYKSSFEELTYLSSPDRAVGPGDLIIATNLGGRGTDLKTTKLLEENGGLHVILSYLPPNVRIEEQAFGRTARAGNEGSGEYIIHSTKNLSFAELCRQRDYEEKRRLEDLAICELKKIEFENELLKGLTYQNEVIEGYQALLNRLGLVLKNKPAFYRDAQLRSLNNRWAFWIDHMEEKISMVWAIGKESVLKSFKQFREGVLDDFRKEEFKFIKEPIELIKLGGEYRRLEKWSEAEKCYAEAGKDPHYAYALYYKAACQLAKSPASSYSARKDFVKNSKQATLAIQHEIEDLQTAIQAITPLVEQRRANGEADYGNPYKARTEEKLQIWSIFLSAIDAAMGSSLSASHFKNSTYIKDEAQAKEVYNTLQRHLKPIRVRKNLSIKEGVLWHKNTSLLKIPPMYLQVLEEIVKKREIDKDTLISECERLMSDYSGSESTKEAAEALWTLLEEKRIIKPPKVKFERDVSFRTRISTIKEDLVAHFHGHPELETVVDSIFGIIDNTIGMIYKLDDKKTTVKFAHIIRKCYHDHSQHAPEGIGSFIELGLEVIADLMEKKDPPAWYEVVAVTALGLAQMVAGVIIKAYIPLAGELIGDALLNSGMDDVIFAVASAITKEFSWDDYACAKTESLKRSLTSSAISCGVSFGVNAIKFKSVDKAWDVQKLSGVEKCEKAGKLVPGTTLNLSRTITHEVGHQLVSTGISQLANRGFEELAKHIAKRYENDIEGAIKRVIDQEWHLVETQAKGLYEKLQGDSSLSGNICECFELSMKAALEPHFLDSVIRASRHVLPKASHLLKESVWGKCMEYAPDIANCGVCLSKLSDLVENQVRLLARYLRETKERKELSSPVTSPISEEAFAQDLNKIKENLTTQLVELCKGHLHSGVFAPLISIMVGEMVSKGSQTFFPMNEQEQIAQSPDALRDILEAENNSDSAFYDETLRRWRKAEAEVTSLSEEDLIQTPLNATETVETLKQQYGDHIKIYKDKEGNFYVQRPTREEYARGIIEGKAISDPDIFACSKALGKNIAIRFPEGQVKMYSLEGKTFTEIPQQPLDESTTLVLEFDRNQNGGGIGHIRAPGSNKFLFNTNLDCFYEAVLKVLGSSDDVSQLRKKTADVLKNDETCKRFYHAWSLSSETKVFAGNNRSEARINAFLDGTDALATIAKGLTITVGSGGLGAAVGVPVALYGADNLYAAAKTLITGEKADPNVVKLMQNYFDLSPDDARELNEIISSTISLERGPKKALPPFFKRVQKVIERVLQHQEVPYDINLPGERKFKIYNKGDPAGNTNSTMKIGREVHAVFMDHVHNRALGLIKEFNRYPGIRPDFIDLNRRIIYELKPNNKRSIREGNKQLTQYRKVLIENRGGEWKVVLVVY